MGRTIDAPLQRRRATTAILDNATSATEEAEVTEAEVPPSPQMEH